MLNTPFEDKTMAFHLVGDDKRASTHERFLFRIHSFEPLAIHVIRHCVMIDGPSLVNWLLQTSEQSGMTLQQLLPHNRT